MELLIKSLTELGVLLTIAGVFIYEHFTTNKNTQKLQETNQELLKQNSSALENIAKALEIIQGNQLVTLEKEKSIERKIDCIKEKANISKKEI